MDLAEHFILPPSEILYKTDLTDAEWDLLEPHLPALPFSLRPRIHRRWLINAIFYIQKAGCQWHLLPREYPNPKTVHFYFTLWNRSGVWETIVAVIHAEERTAMDKEVLPSALVLDSRSTKVVAKGGIQQLALTSTKR